MGHEGPQAAGPAPLKDYPAEERQKMEASRAQPPPPPPPAANNEPERAARKVDVNENYDDDDEEDKKGGIVGANGSGPAAPPGDTKTANSTGGAINGVTGAATKVEAS